MYMLIMQGKDLMQICPKGKYLYMKITRDKYEFPIVVADTAEELALLIGVTSNTIYKNIFEEEHGGCISCYKRVLLDDTEE